jgi:hypothetical protein
VASGMSQGRLAAELLSCLCSCSGRFGSW